MTSHNLIVLDDEAMERPPYTGIEQWAMMRKATDKGRTTISNGTPSMPEMSSASESPSSHNPRHRKPSAYLHIPVTQPQASDPPHAANLALTLWHVPPQQVCKDGATPTAVCGRYSTALNDPPVNPITRGGTGPYKCPRCHVGYSRIDTVRQHFPHCIALNGNPDCLSWTDDDSYAAGVADRSASKVEGRVILKARKPGSRAAHLVTLGISELIIRITTHARWNFNGLKPSGGELPGGNGTEEEDEAWKKIAKNLKEETRNAQEISPETEALIGMFKEDGLWDSEPSDEN